MVGLAFATARDLADGLHVLASVLASMLRGADLGVEWTEDGGGLVYEFPSDHRHGVDHLLSSVLTVARTCVRGDLHPTRVDLRSARPVHTGRYVQVFSVEPTFDADVCFERAFRRWTGESPAGFRRRLEERVD